MIEGVDNPQNKDKIAIVVVGYNRLNSIKRLLESLLLAKYDSNDIPLVISIDNSGDEELYGYVRNFTWPFGGKYVNIQTTRLGLLKHIYQCGDLTQYFKAIILLEDDLFVSPVFYSYAKKTVERYGDSEDIAEISLYKNEINGFVGLPFETIQTGYDVFLAKDVSTWGQCWTKQMWDGFTRWRDAHTEEDVQRADIPIQIKKWTRAWSRYYNAYVTSSEKYVLYPNRSLTTNFSDAGEHGGTNNTIVQVNLLQEDFDYRFGELQSLPKYDCYGNNESLYEWVGVTKEEITLDLFGQQDSDIYKRYVLSTKLLPYKKVRTYALHMRPMELNVKYNIKGEGITLYDTSVKEKVSNGYNHFVVPYLLKGFNNRLLLKYVLRYYKNIILEKIGC